MSSSDVPTGPSPEEIARQEREQTRRVRFEQERMDYLGKVGAYELASSTMRQRRANSLEYGGGPIEPPVESLFVPMRFEPTTSDIPLDELVTYDWFKAENLGLEGMPEFANRNAENAYVKQAQFNQKYFEALQSFDSWKNAVPERYYRRNPMPSDGMEDTAQYMNQTRSNRQIAEGDFLKPVGGGYYDRLIRSYLNRGSNWRA